jgi:hypothetical protein
MLLPMDKATLQEQSLAYHLALTTCCDGQGNGHLFNVLMRVIYVAWFLQRAGYGNEPVQHYKLAEVAVEAALGSAHQSGEWHLDESAAPAFEKLLSLHDSQLNVAPLYKVIEAEKQLKRFLDGTSSSPIPEPGGSAGCMN